MSSAKTSGVPRSSIEMPRFEDGTVSVTVAPADGVPPDSDTEPATLPRTSESGVSWESAIVSGPAGTTGDTACDVDVPSPTTCTTSTIAGTMAERLTVKRPPESVTTASACVLTTWSATGRPSASTTVPWMSLPPDTGGAVLRTTYTTA